jgi:hypothetical protein
MAKAMIFAAANFTEGCTMPKRRKGRRPFRVRNCWSAYQARQKGATKKKRRDEKGKGTMKKAQ